MVVSAADGVLALDWASWELDLADESDVSILVQLPGFLPAMVPLERAHATPADARVIRLVRPARIEVTVRDALGAPLPRLRVDVQVPELAGDLAPSVRTAARAATTDAAGACAFEELPPRATLAVAVRAGNGRTQRNEVVLAPGETRTVAFEIGAACALLGRALDEDGAPIVGLDVWRLAAGDGRRILVERDENAVVEKARTDAHGAFTFASVPPGAWWIAPAPSQRTRAVALAERVVVAPGASTQTVTLVVRAPRAIRGHVTGTAGTAHVVALQDDLRAEAESRLDGSFAVQPLCAGEWQLWAWQPGGGACAPVTVRAGEVRAELHLERGADLRVHTNDAAERLEARITCNGAPLLVLSLAAGEARATLPPGLAQVELVRRAADGSASVVATAEAVLVSGRETSLELAAVH